MQAAHLYSTNVSVRLRDARRKDARQKARHYIVTEQYQNSLDSVNKCVLFVSQLVEHLALTKKTGAQ